MCSTDRYCKWTTVINGVTLPKGAIVAVPISVLHHSPLYWEDPEKFDPDRLDLAITNTMQAQNSNIIRLVHCQVTLRVMIEL
jgi:cytochrome P450